MGRAFSGLTIAFWLLPAAAAFSAPKPPVGACRSYRSAWLERDIEYCSERSRPDLEARSGEPVVYFLHAFRESARQWWSYGYAESLDRLRREGGLPAFRVVSFTTTMTSFYSDAQGIPLGRQAHESWFLREFLPRIEREYDVCRERACRHLAGHSMGGIGAIKIALRHPATFASTSGQSAALFPFPLYEPLWRWGVYFAKHPASGLFAPLLMKEARRIFPSAAIADENDPAEIIPSFAGPRPSIYVDMGTRDEFGYMQGLERFDEAMDDADWPYASYVQEDGKHKADADRREHLLRHLVTEMR
jgi:S-formylglutathione hydrolase FrmB